MSGRLIYLPLLFLIIAVGLSTKKMTGIITEIIDFKDVMWSVMVYFLIRVIFLRMEIKKVALIGLLFSFLIEFSQLYHAEWIDRIRMTWPGQLILGTSFVWSDLIAYSVGILIGLLIDYFIRNTLNRKM